MNSKVKKWLLGLFLVFFVLPILLAVLGSLFSSESEVSENAATRCVLATEEDMNNIKEGLTRSSLALAEGFAANFSEDDISQITAVFPTFTSPRVVGAQIEGSGSESDIGLWGIQDFDYGWRILALNDVAREYSNHGVDIDDNSASGRVRSKMLELSVNTNVFDCLDQQN
jgi:hypothetical protein